jgi:hypothetical protein
MTYRMKTALLAATSLTFIAGGTAQAEEWDIRFGGYYNAMVAYASNDAATGNGVDDTNGLGLSHNTEFFFQPTITLDNGIKISARMDFEADNDGIGVDEPELRISGSFGSLILGSMDRWSMARQTLPSFLCMMPTSRLISGGIPGPMACHSATIWPNLPMTSCRCKGTSPASAAPTRSGLTRP